MHRGNVLEREGNLGEVGGGGGVNACCDEDEVPAVGVSFDSRGY